MLFSLPRAARLRPHDRRDDLKKIGLYSLERQQEGWAQRSGAELGQDIAFPLEVVTEYEVGAGV
jgi:hypothetical protein